jgi:hypothetical protein
MITFLDKLFYCRQICSRIVNGLIQLFLKFFSRQCSRFGCFFLEFIKLLLSMLYSSLNVCHAHVHRLNLRKNLLNLILNRFMIYCKIVLKIRYSLIQCRYQCFKSRLIGFQRRDALRNEKDVELGPVGNGSERLSTQHCDSTASSKLYRLSPI